MKFGMAKFGAGKNCYQFLITTGKFGTKPPDCGTARMGGEWLLLVPVGLWLVAGNFGGLQDGCKYFLGAFGYLLFIS